MTKKYIVYPMAIKIYCIPNDQKIYQMAKKYIYPMTKKYIVYPMAIKIYCIPNDHKIYQKFPLQRPSKIYQKLFFGGAAVA
jgi:hypothetical protein